MLRTGIQTVIHLGTLRQVYSINFLFANVPKGVEASAIIYSLVETAKENGLDLYRYLAWLMHEVPKLNLSVEDQAAQLLPIKAPEKCRLKLRF
ncbi:MAG: transposase domain-containing protein [Peptococcales bacterium]